MRAPRQPCTADITVSYLRREERESHGCISDIYLDPMQALLLSHPRKLIRDTARYPPLMRATAPGRRPKPRALRHLAAQHLALAIQAGEHSPVDDARAALYLYLRFQKVSPLHLLQSNQLRGPGLLLQPWPRLQFAPETNAVRLPACSRCVASSRGRSKCLHRTMKYL